MIAPRNVLDWQANAKLGSSQELPWVDHSGTQPVKNSLSYRPSKCLPPEADAILDAATMRTGTCIQRLSQTKMS
jgi:hypothetical protein